MSEERRGWLPRGALVFLVVAALLVVAFAVVRPAVLEDDGDGDDGETAGGPSFTTTLGATGAVDGVRLSDDNATSQSFTVPVPVDAGLHDAVLTLAGRTQVSSRSTIYLRVLADGQSAYVAELPAGDHDLAAEVPLPPSAVADGSVRIQVRTTGTVDHQRCTLTQELGAFVLLDPEGTRVHAALDRDLATVRDVAAALDHDVTLVLADPDDRAWFEQAARLGAALTQAGHDVAFATQPQDGRSTVLLGPTADGDPVGVGEVEGEAVLALTDPAAAAVPTFLTTAAIATGDGATSDPVTTEPQRPAGGAVTLTDLGVDTGVQQLTDSRTWRASYSLADLPGGQVPTAADLSFRLPLTSDDSRWLVQVQYGGELVRSVRVPGDATSARVTAALPTRLATVRDQLVVTLTRDRDVGGCHVRQTSYAVQLLGSSRLVLGGATTGLAAIPAAWSGGMDVVVTATAAADPLASLAGLVPTLAELGGWRRQPRFVWAEQPADRPFLLVGTPPAAPAPVVGVGDGRVSAQGTDLGPLADGVVVQRLDSGSAPGVVLTPVGAADATLPSYGTELAWVLAGDGGGFVVSPSGRVVTTPPVRAGSSG